MKTNHQSDAELTPEIAQTLMWKVTEALIRYGVIDPKDKTKEQLLKEVRASLDYIDIEGYVFDHQGILLREARLNRKKGLTELACLLYATWFEHWLNSIIQTFALRFELSNDDVERILKELNFDSKSTWLLQLLGAKPISQGHRNLMKQVTDIRNGFVHYKWKRRNKQQEKELEQVLDKVEKTMKYLREYENKYVFNSHRRKVENLLKSDGQAQKS